MSNYLDGVRSNNLAKKNCNFCLELLRILLERSGFSRMSLRNFEITYKVTKVKIFLKKVDWKKLEIKYFKVEIN